MTRLTFVSALSLALCLVGCDDDSMGDTDSGPGGGVDAGPGGGMDAGPGDTDAGPGGDTDAGPGGDTDAGPGGDTDAGPGDTDAGGGGMTGVACGMETCDSATEQCCTSGFGMTSSTCIPNTEMCMGASRTCDGPEDCASGEVCCGRRSGGINLSVTCVAAAMCDGGGFGGPYELCRDAADCSTMGDMCCPAMFVPGIDGFCDAMCSSIGPGTP